MTRGTAQSRWIARCFAILFCTVTSLWSQGFPEKTRVEKLSYRDEDLLQVVNNAGVVHVRTWNRNEVEARWIEHTPSAGVRRPRVDFLRHEGKIFLIASAADVPARLELRVPAKSRLFVQGIEPRVTISGVKGLVVARTLRGRIDIIDATGPVLAFSRSGEIHYQVKKRPVRPALLLTAGADVYCHVPETIPVDVEIAVVRNVGTTRSIGRQPADCASRHGQRPCLRIVRGDKGRVYHYEGVEPASGDGSTDGVAAPPELLNTAPLIAAELPTPLKRERPAGDAIPSFRVDVDWVGLNVSVAERRGGRRVFGLGSDDFEVYEDGILQEIQSLQGTDEPFHLLLLLDISGSTASYLPILKRAVEGFAGTLRRDDQLALAAFNCHPFLVQRFTNNKRLVKRALRRISAGGGTGFYEALGFGLDLLSGVTGRKAMVVFTDGMDEILYGRFEQAADITFPEVLEKLKETDALLYTVSLDSKKVLVDLMAKGHNEPLVEPILEETRAQLQSISDHSGTPLYSPTQPRELASIFAAIAEDLKSRYTISYRSNNPVKDGRWRKLTVKIANHSEYAVRARRGYFAARGAGR